MMLVLGLPVSYVMPPKAVQWLYDGHCAGQKVCHLRQLLTPVTAGRPSVTMDLGKQTTTRECGSVELEAVTVPPAVREGWTAVPAHLVDAYSVCRHTGEARGISL